MSNARERLKLVVHMAHPDVVAKVERRWKQLTYMNTEILYGIIEGMLGMPKISAGYESVDLAVNIAQYSDNPSVRDALIEYFNENDIDWCVQSTFGEQS